MRLYGTECDWGLGRLSGCIVDMMLFSQLFGQRVAKVVACIPTGLYFYSLNLLIFHA